MQIELGIKVKDKITGFKGTVTGIVHYISGCNQALVVPPVSKTGAAPEAQWYDLQRLEVTDKKKVVLDNGATPGFDKAAPIR